MMIDRLEGNSELKTSVRLMLGGRRMTHSVLLVGEEGLGTGFAARCVAADAHVALDLLPNALKGRPAKPCSGASAAVPWQRPVSATAARSRQASSGKPSP